MVNQVPPIQTQPILPNPVIVKIEDPQVVNSALHFNENFKKVMQLLPWWQKVIALSPSLSNLIAFILLCIFANHPFATAVIGLTHIFFIAVFLPVYIFAQVPYSGLWLIKSFAVKAIVNIFFQPTILQSQDEKNRTAILNGFSGGMVSMGTQMAMAVVFALIMYGPHASEYITTVFGSTNEVQALQPIRINNTYNYVIEKKDISPPAVVPAKKHHSLHGLPLHKLHVRCPSHILSKARVDPK